MVATIIWTVRRSVVPVRRPRVPDGIWSETGVGGRGLTSETNFGGPNIIRGRVNGRWASDGTVYDRKKFYIFILPPRPLFRKVLFVRTKRTGTRSAADVVGFAVKLRLPFCARASSDLEKMSYYVRLWIRVSMSLR